MFERVRVGVALFLPSPNREAEVEGALGTSRRRQRCGVALLRRQVLAGQRAVDERDRLGKPVERDE